MAQDLDRWLNGEAVLARDLGRWTRTLNWLKNHIAVLATCGIALLALLALLFGQTLLTGLLVLVMTGVSVAYSILETRNKTKLRNALKDVEDKSAFLRQVQQRTVELLQQAEESAAQVGSRDIDEPRTK